MMRQNSPKRFVHFWIAILCINVDKTWTYNIKNVCLAEGREGETDGPSKTLRSGRPAASWPSTMSNSKKNVDHYTKWLTYWLILIKTHRYTVCPISQVYFKIVPHNIKLERLIGSYCIMYCLFQIRRHRFCLIFPSSFVFLFSNFSISIRKTKVWFCYKNYPNFKCRHMNKTSLIYSNNYFPALKIRDKSDAKLVSVFR